MIGSTLGHGRYRLLEKIGEGGMGVVYLARDERLRREVAVKVLPTGKLHDESVRHRFRREALALSALNHPGIAIVHDFDHDDGIDFLVSEFIPGDTLEQPLREGLLAEAKIIRLAEQLVEGLAAAHGKGVIHRDLKPGNLKVTPEGRLKILDFGIAKILGPAAETEITMTVTSPGLAIGTVPYMSPEQLRGDEVDGRSDLYSAGVVLYELATGRRPFVEATVTKLADAILHTPPEPPRHLRLDLSAAFERVILRCLAKAPADRYATAGELLEDLRKLGTPHERSIAAARAERPRRHLLLWAAGAVSLVALGAFVVPRILPPSGTASRGPVRLVVLPFANLSREKDQEFFSDGLTDEMITQLGSVSPGRMAVIGRTSAMRYKDRKRDAKTLRRDLGVEYILDGSVRRASDRVRITAMLVRATSETQEWSKTYDGSLSDVFGLQANVAKDVARTLAIRLAPDRERALTKKPTENPEAHDEYLRGREAWARRDRAGIEKGIAYFKAAIAADSGFALAYAGLADSYLLLANYDIVAPREAMPLAKSAALTALRLDPTLGEAHASLASILADYEWNWAAADSEFKRAIELRPQYVLAHQWYADFLSSMRRDAEALREIEIARRLDPLWALGAQLDYGSYFYQRGQLDRAIDEFRKAAEMEPTSPRPPALLAVVYFEKGLADEAQAALERQFVLSGAEPKQAANLARTFRESGLHGLRRAELDQRLEDARTSYVSPYEIGSLYAALGDKDLAFQWLERAWQERSSGLVGMHVDRLLDGLRNDTRYGALGRRVGLPETAGT